MNKRLKSAIQIGISLTLGFLLIWFIVKDLTLEDKNKIIDSFSDANYWWILAATGVAVLSHVFRAYRWKYTLDSLDMKVDMPNRFLSVMIGYLFNLAFPRLGEVTRCALITRYKNLPFEKVFGTVIAERFIDAIILLMIMIVTFFSQIDVLRDWVLVNLGPRIDAYLESYVFGVIALVGLIGAFIAWRFLRESTHPVAQKVRSKIEGLLTGFASLKTMKGQHWFYMHTAFIWLCYILMHFLTFQCFPETAALSIGAVIASFALGGLTIVAVQGGLGAYPLAIMAILTLYGIDKDLGYAFGWISWTSQTLMIIVVGFVSMLIMPVINRKSAEMNV